MITELAKAQERGMSMLRNEGNQSAAQDAQELEMEQVEMSCTMIDV